MRREGGGGGLANVRSVCRGASLLYVGAAGGKGGYLLFSLGSSVCWAWAAAGT